MTTGESFEAFFDREMADKDAEEFKKIGDYKPSPHPPRGWKRIETIKITLFTILLAVVDAGMILYVLGEAA